MIVVHPTENKKLDRAEHINIKFLVVVGNESKRESISIVCMPSLICTIFLTMALISSIN